MPRLGLWVFRSLQETYEAKRNEFLGELQKKEEEMRQMFVMRVKEKEAELKEAEKEVSCASSRSLKPEAGFLSALVINGASHWCTHGAFSFPFISRAASPPGKGCRPDILAPASRWQTESHEVE